MKIFHIARQLCDHCCISIPQYPSDVHQAMVDKKTSPLLLFYVSCSAITIQRPPFQKLGYDHQMKATPALGQIQQQYWPDSATIKDFAKTDVKPIQKEGNNVTIYKWEGRLGNNIQTVVDHHQANAFRFSFRKMSDTEQSTILGA